MTTTYVLGLDLVLTLMLTLDSELANRCQSV